MTRRCFLVFRGLIEALRSEDTSPRAEEEEISELLADILYNEHTKKVGGYLTNSFQRNIRYLHTKKVTYIRGVR